MVNAKFQTDAGWDGVWSVAEVLESAQEPQDECEAWLQGLGLVD